jgi:hypothetical protein
MTHELSGEILRNDEGSLIRPEPPQALLGLRAMKTVASAAGPIGTAQDQGDARR